MPLKPQLSENPDIDDERAGRVPELSKPFGYLSAKWEELKAKMKPGDEFWTFRSSDKSWQQRAGREGIALVRSGQMICAIVTKMS